MDVGLDRSDRLIYDQLDSDRSGEVVHDIALLDEDVAHLRVANVVDHQSKVWVVDHRRKVFKAAGAQIIQRDDVVAPVQKTLCEVGADESGAAGDENLHSPRF